MLEKKLTEEEKFEGRGGGMRAAMPHAAALVDELRAAFGRQWVDDALREGLRLQREHNRLQQQQGSAAADAWLSRQRPGRPSLRIVEAGIQVGELAGGHAGAIP